MCSSLLYLSSTPIYHTYNNRYTKDMLHPKVSDTSMKLYTHISPNTIPTMN